LRYAERNDTWSSAVNAFMRENGLSENDRQTAYSLRHSFEDRLLESGVDDRIRADLMGHRYSWPEYGSGCRLATVAALIAPIAH
jgi:integrase